MRRFWRVFLGCVFFIYPDRLPAKIHVLHRNFIITSIILLLRPRKNIIGADHDLAKNRNNLTPSTTNLAE